LTAADIAELMADEDWVAANVAKHRPKILDTARFERFFDHMSLYNCVYEAFQLERGTDVVSGRQKDIQELIGALGKITPEIANECKDELFVAIMGKAFGLLLSPAQRAEMAENMVRSLFDFKAALAVNEAQWAKWASRVGLDYFHGRLTMTQARDPRIDLFEGFDWPGWLRPKSNCIEKSSAAWNVYSAKLLLRHDLTGDGYAEYILVGECPSSTSRWPQVVYIVDGLSEPSNPRLIGTFDDDYWRDVKVRTSGSGRKSVLTLSGEALSENASFCCPDLHVTLKYRWDRNKFQRTSRKVTRIPI
jgi:hypothetical protein